MNEIARFDRRECEELFFATAHNIKLLESMVERDYDSLGSIEAVFERLNGN